MMWKPEHPRFKNTVAPNGNWRMLKINMQLTISSLAKYCTSKLIYYKVTPCNYVGLTSGLIHCKTHSQAIRIKMLWMWSALVLYPNIKPHLHNYFTMYSLPNSYSRTVVKRCICLKLTFLITIWRRWFPFDNVSYSLEY